MNGPKTFAIPLLLVASTVYAATRAVAAPVDPAVLQAENDRVAVVEQASRAAVAIFASNGQGGGSGVVISPDGYALSNFHVTAEAGEAMKCGMADGQVYDAVIVGLDPTGDVALIKLLGRDDFPHAELGDSDRVQVGDWCFAIGNPFLLATDFRPSVSYGVISGVHRYQYPAGTLLEYADCLQSDAAINPGNSGGPMFDAGGRLIGINGRGSFEKRGRVNVGVGYAISINQIKHFLGHLKSGRIVDHATLGAQLRSDEEGRVLVDDILEESDAYRRGLRYGDEVIRFAGRPTPTVNSFKNALGIFPKGWRVQLTYRRDGETHDVFVRLAGVHSDAELSRLAATQPDPHPKKPEEKPKEGKDGPQPPREPAPLPKALRPAKKSAPMPDIVKRHYKSKRGYINYFFNELERERVWKACASAADFSRFKGTWTIEGELTGGGEVQFVLNNEQATIELAGVKVSIPLKGDLSEALDPPGSGGLLAALAGWRRLLVEGPGKFGDVYYLGTLPIPPRSGSFDVLVGEFGSVDYHIMFDPGAGQPSALEMYADPNGDPAEIFFGDYREVEGGLLPHRLEVRHGDMLYQTIKVKRYRLEPGTEN